MKVIKCGGSILKDITNRKRLYKEIKTLEDKVILIVSAFNDSPYSTNSLNNLITNNYTFEMKQELLVIGEIISSIRVCNELLNEYIDADVLYKEEIGIIVQTTDKMEQIVSLDNSKIKEKINKHKVIVVPGFIGINQDNKIVTLNKNGSDLTALLIAKMLEIDEVFLYKDVLGLSSIDPSVSTNYKLYKNISYDLMNQIVMHGNGLVQDLAVKIAKENKINIHIQNFLNHNFETLVSTVSKERIVVFTESRQDIFIDGFTNKDFMENILRKHKLQFDYILPCNSYLKVVTSYNNQKQILLTLNNLYVKGEF